MKDIIIPFLLGLAITGLVIISWELGKRSANTQHCEQMLDGIAVSRDPVVCLRKDAVLKVYK